MGLLFKSDFHDGFGSWPLAYIPYGGIDFGEILGIAQAVGDGNDSDFYRAWMAAGDRFAAEATDTLAKGRQPMLRDGQTSNFRIPGRSKTGRGFPETNGRVRPGDGLIEKAGNTDTYSI
jgi:hypothetical protein